MATPPTSERWAMSGEAILTTIGYQIVAVAAMAVAASGTIAEVTIGMS